MFTIVIGYGTA